MSVKNYVIITPAHNEETFIQLVLDSIVAQTMQPAQWVIVDDGSSDDTANIIQGYVDKNPWIKLVKNTPQDAKRQGGGKVVRAFMLGYQALDVSDFEFIVKLDADLTLPVSYFEGVREAFESDPMVGMCGGYLSVFSNGRWNREKSASYHLRGAMKAYRRSCFEQMGGLRPVDNWDFLDEMTAMYLGWTVKILQLGVRHHRPTSTLINRGLKYSYKMGLINYKDGYDLFLTLLRSVNYGLNTRPYVLSALSLVLGFVLSSITKPEKDVDAELERFIRRFQYKRIGKFVQTHLRRVCRVLFPKDTGV